MRLPRFSPACALAEAEPQILHLGIGQPGRDLMPEALMREAAVEATGINSSWDAFDLYQYGGQLGPERYRRALATFLSRHQHRSIDADGLMLTNGNSQALELISASLTQPGDAILVADPTYFLAHGIFSDHGLSPTPVPHEAGQLTTVDLDALEAILGAHAVGHFAFFYVVPNFSNPTGGTMPAAAKHRLVALARTYDFVIVSDDPYALLYYDDGAEPSVTLAQAAGAVGAPECVVTCGTFSKLIGPGLRVGWIESAPSRVDRLASRGFLNSGGGLNPFVACLVAAMIDNGTFDGHLGALRQALGQRMLALVSSINEHLGPDTAVAPNGGYFVWIEVPGADQPKFPALCREEGLSYFPASRFFHASGHPSSLLRLSFSFYDAERLQAVGPALRRAVERTH